MGLNKLFIAPLLVFSNLLFAQETDSTYIQKFPEKITFRLGLQNTSNSFDVRRTENNVPYRLEPNKQDYFTASILFRSLELDYGFAPGFLSVNKDNENSTLFNLNFRMFLGQWMQTIDLYAQKGFYAIIDDERTYIETLKTTKIGGKTAYIFNKNFSFRAIGFQNEWQKKSAGSFIPHLSFYHTKFQFNDTEVNEESSSLDLTVAPSYHYNFVLKKHFILSVGAGAGVGLNLFSENEVTIGSSVFEFNTRIATGYNSEHFFGGINGNLFLLAHNADRYARLNDELSFLEFYIGYRFNAPKKWVKAADDFNRKFGL